MRFVLDASVTMTWAMADEDHPLAHRALDLLRSGSTMVPAIWWYEVRNILVASERRGRISPDDSGKFLLALQQLAIAVEGPGNDTQTIALARQYNLSVFDAAYLALSMRERLPLATLDRKLEATARDAGIQLLA